MSRFIALDSKEDGYTYSEYINVDCVKYVFVMQPTQKTICVVYETTGGIKKSYLCFKTVMDCVCRFREIECALLDKPYYGKHVNTIDETKTRKDKK